MKKYVFKFYYPSLLLFILTMIPTIFWSIFPAIDDVLRVKSNTPKLDIFTSFFQVGFILILCFFVNKDSNQLKLNSIYMHIVTFCLTVYYVSWIIYYLGIHTLSILLLLALMPSLLFLCFAIDRKNYIALIPIFFFTVGHFIFTISNFYRY